MLIWRIVLAGLGILTLVYGIGRLVLGVPAGLLAVLSVWLLAVLIIHHGVLSPLVIAVSWALRRSVPDRGRRFLQIALIMGAIVTVVAIPLILREDSQPTSKAMLQLSYGASLTLLLGLIAVVSLIMYAARVARGRSGGAPADERRG